MPLPTRGRSSYNPVSSTDAEEDNLNSSSDDSDENASGQTFSQVVGSELIVSKEDTPLTAETPLRRSTVSSKSMLDEEDSDIEIDDNGERISIVVMDPAQKRFPVLANPDWTVLTFKKVGAKVHKVPPSSQRLIFQGKMLEDSKTLRDSRIDKADVILHLFPKPRVVVTSGSSNLTEGDGDEDNRGGAHVPQIILDEEEQERRGQILVLGSAEIAEAQNNVKLLSLLLLVICSMRLLALFSIAMGVAEEPYEDDLVPPAGGGTNHTSDPGDPDNYEMRSWENQDYLDLAVSAVGFYVATLGMKATTENTLRLATAYLVGTVIAGVGWNIWNIFMYTLFVEEESQPKDDDNAVPLSRDDFVTVAFFTVMLPMMVWVLCCTRAWQFRQLIEEAEQEAAERIRSQLTLTEGNDDNVGFEDENASELTEISRSEDGRPTIV